jgi:hypothetical protein
MLRYTHAPLPTDKLDTPKRCTLARKGRAITADNPHPPHIAFSILFIIPEIMKRKGAGESLKGSQIKHLIYQGGF